MSFDYKNKAPFFKVMTGELMLLDEQLRMNARYYPIGYLCRFEEYFKEVLNGGWHVSWEQLAFDNLFMKKIEAYHVHVFFKWTDEFQNAMRKLLMLKLHQNVPENLQPRLTKLIYCDIEAEQLNVFKFGQADLKEPNLMLRVWTAMTADISFMLELLRSRVITKEQEAVVVEYLNARYEYMLSYPAPEIPEELQQEVDIDAVVTEDNINDEDDEDDEEEEITLG